MRFATVMPLRPLTFFEGMGLALVVVLIAVMAICFVIIPLSRYIAVRIWLFIRCVFCRAKFSLVGLPGFIIPHFWNHKPDYMLLSGNKLYLIKLKSYRKVKSRVVFASPTTWEIYSHRGVAPNDTEGFLDRMTTFFYKIGVHKRKRKSPVKLVKYAASVNNAIKDTPVDCVPVVLINPSIKELRTLSNIDMIDGDTIYYGIVIANHFYPSKPEKCAVSGKEARKIFRAARRAMTRRHYTDIKKGF